MTARIINLPPPPPRSLAAATAARTSTRVIEADVIDDVDCASACITPHKKT